MQSIQKPVFDKKVFITTITIFIVLSIAWTVLCILTDEFTKRDKGFISGLGFLLLFAASLSLGQPKKSISNFMVFSGITILTFVVGSFGLGPLMASFQSSMVPYAIANAIFVAITMTFFVNKFIAIEYKTETRIVIFLMLILSYWLIDGIDGFFYLGYYIHARFFMFNIFQFFLILPLTLGMTLKSRASAAAEKNIP